MAIVSVNEVWEGRGAELQGDYARTYTRVFQVLTDNVNTSEQTVMLAPGVPRVRTTYVGADGAADAGALLRRVSPQQDSEEPRKWLVRCEYSTSEEELGVGQGSEGTSGGPGGPGSGGANGEPNTETPVEPPEARPPEVEWTSETYQRVLERDTSGFVVANRAGDKFDPPIEVEMTIPVCKYTRNELSFDPDTMIRYTDVLNESAFWGYPPGCVKLTTGPAVRQFEDGLLYWRVTYTLKFKRPTNPEEEEDGGTWDLRILNAGRNVRVEVAPGVFAKDAARSNLGEILPDPVKLGESGEMLPEDGEPIYDIFKPYYRINFDELGLVPVF